MPNLTCYSVLQIKMGPEAFTSTVDELFAGGGEMGALMRNLDWSQTPLGPVEQWPQSLRTSVSICLNSRFAILVWWGPKLVKIYNDAYRPLIGDKHPWALGAPGLNVWPEIWDTIGPMLEQVMQQGKATWADDLLLLLERNGYAEECYFTFPTARYGTSPVAWGVCSPPFRRRQKE